MKLQELQTALKPEFNEFFIFEDTVNQVCAHFVTIDDGRVSLIHDTARQFLTFERDSSSPLISSREAHAQVAMRCFSYLSQDSWIRAFRTLHLTLSQEDDEAPENRLISAEQGAPRLGYATCYWAYHVSKPLTSNQELTRTLKIFFSHYLLF